MRIVKLSALILALVGGACGDEDLSQGSGNLLNSEGDSDAASQEGEGPPGTPVADAGDFLDQCVRGGGSVGMIRVVFDCDSITVYSCKDISNVVIELENGERQRSEGGGLGQVSTFSGTNGGRIVGVWVKAGSNHSGDGPGYGQRFDAPDVDCDPPEGGSGGTGGVCGSNDPDEVCAGAGGNTGEGGAGSGGNGGTSGSCGSNDPDQVCAGAGGVGAGGNGGEPICTEGSEDPLCTVD
jgi:hypothetical protein